MTRPIDGGLAKQVSVEDCTYDSGILTFQLNPKDSRHDVDFLVDLTRILPGRPWVTELL